ncbi:MAG: hypothetical protein ABSD89_01175 [Halobacteriota archaeon]
MDETFGMPMQSALLTIDYKPCGADVPSNLQDGAHSSFVDKNRLNEEDLLIVVMSLLRPVTYARQETVFGENKERNWRACFAVDGLTHGGFVEGFRVLQFLGTVINYFSDATVMNLTGPTPAKEHRVKDWALFLGDNNILFSPFGTFGVVDHRPYHDSIFCTIEFYTERRPNELARFILDWLKAGVEEGWVAFDCLTPDDEAKARERVEQLDRQLASLGYKSMTFDTETRNLWLERKRGNKHRTK